MPYALGPTLGRIGLDKVSIISQESYGFQDCSHLLFAVIILLYIALCPCNGSHRNKKYGLRETQLTEALYLAEGYTT